MFPPLHCSTLPRLSFVQGIGRATFEGTLKATFADFFSYEKEGAFGNIILQNGLAGTIGYFCKSFPSCISSSCEATDFSHRCFLSLLCDRKWRL